MSKFFHRATSFLAMAAIGLTAVSFSSCSDDDPIDDKGLGDSPNPPVKIDHEVKLNSTWEAYYFYPDYINKDFGNYYFELASGAVGVEAGGINTYPLNPGDYLLLVDINSVLADRSNILLPEGTYTAADGIDRNNTFNIQNTMAIYNMEKTGEGQYRFHYYKFTDGTITVKYNADATYTLDCTFTAKENGEKWHFTFTGAIPFEDKTGDEGDWWGFHEDVNVTAKAANYVLYSTKDNIDEYALRLFSTANLTPDQMHVNNINECKVELELYTAPGAGIAGTYTVGDKKRVGAAAKGKRFGSMAAGSFVEQVIEDWTARYAILESGTITVTDNGGGNYAVNVDCLTAEGKTVKLTYRGQIPDNTGFVPVFSTLLGDVEFNAIACTSANYYGDYYGTGANNYAVTLASNREILFIDFFSASGDASAIPTGTFTVADTYTDGTMTPGTVDGSSLVPSIYIIVENNQTAGYAPIKSGTMTITHSAAGYTFTYDLRDDATNPNRIYGTCTVPDSQMPAITDYTTGTADLSSHSAIKAAKASFKR